MPIDTTKTPVYRKLSGGKFAQQKHGIQGWCNGEPVIYYDHLGWFTAAECAAYAAKKHRSGKVYASRYSWIPAAKVEGNWGWRWYEGRHPRTRVYRMNRKWTFIERLAS